MRSCSVINNELTMLKVQSYEKYNENENENEKKCELRNSE